MVVVMVALLNRCASGQNQVHLMSYVRIIILYLMFGQLCG